MYVYIHLYIYYIDTSVLIENIQYLDIRKLMHELIVNHNHNEAYLPFLSKSLLVHCLLQSKCS